MSAIGTKRTSRIEAVPGYRYLLSGAGIAGSIRLRSLLSSSGESSFGGARVISPAFSPKCTRPGMRRTTKSSNHCATKNGTSARRNGRKGAGFCNAAHHHERIAEWRQQEACSVSKMSTETQRASAARISKGGITIGTITKMISKASSTKAHSPITQHHGGREAVAAGIAPTGCSETISARSRG